MQIVLTTGCPDSGWEGVLPILQEAGLDIVGKDFKDWHDSFFGNEAHKEAIDNHVSLTPAQDYTNKISTLLSNSSSSDILLAESRSIWLLDYWASYFPDIKFILFFTTPQTALSHALQNELDPIHFLEVWQTANRQLIQFQSHHRKRAVLLSAEAACQNPGGLVEIAKHAGIDLKPVNDARQTALACDLPPLESMFVSSLATLNSLQELYVELEARAHVLGNSNTHVKHGQVDLYNYYLEQKSNEKRLLKQSELFKELKQVKETTEEENELLVLQLHQVQEELEYYYRRNRDIEKRWGRRLTVLTIS